MRGFLRPGRLVWLAGIVLLIGTVAGAGWLLNHSKASADGGAAPNKDGSYPFNGRFIIAFGYVDVLPGVTRIYPLVPGKVEWLASEGDAVQAGQPLLRLDAALARSDLAKAKFALKDAEEVYKQAQRLTEKHDLEVKAQESAVAAAKSEKEATQAQIDKINQLLKQNVGGNTFDVKSLEAKLKKIDAVIAAEQAKLDILNLFGPDDQINRARLGVDLKKQIVEHAELGLKNYTVLAPTDGTVLRTYTSVGEVLGPNPKVPAIEFCPTRDQQGKPLRRIIRAEVAQEWADRVKEGQDVVIEDDSSAGYHWKGKVVRISDWFTHRRSIIQEPFQFNDVRTLECIVQVSEEPQGAKLRIGQRMRVMINQGGP